MDTSTVYRVEFSAAHQTPSGHSPDGLNHGHEWQVEIEAIRGYDYSLDVAVGGLLAEFNGRDLAKMAPDMDGLALAAMLMERFALTYPAITRVTIFEGRDLAHTVRREPRRTT